MKSFWEFAAMGGYGVYIWPAYGVAVLVIGGLFLWSWRGHRAATKRELELGRRSRRSRKETAS
jgi:heme exporter protein D